MTLISTPSLSLILPKATPSYIKKKLKKLPMGALRRSWEKTASVNSFKKITMEEHLPTCSRRRDSYSCSFHLSLLVKLNIHNDPRLNSSRVPLAIQLLILIISRINVGPTQKILCLGHAQSTNFGRLMRRTLHH